MAKLIQYSSKYNLIKRFLVCPFFLCIMIVVSNIQAIRTWIMFLRFGGEHLIYNKDDFASMDKIYQELKRKEAPNA